MRITRFIPLFTAFGVICTGALLPLCGQDVSTTPPSPAGSKGETPIEITADGQNTYFGNIMTADDNVVVRSGDDVIFADHVTCDRGTKILVATGNVRIFSDTRVYRGSAVTYNLDTKELTSSNFVGEDFPKFVTGQTITTPEFNHYHLTNGSFTTDNREKPSFHMEARTMEYRPDDEVVMKNVTVYIGSMPVFTSPFSSSLCRIPARPTSLAPATAAALARFWITPTTGWPTATARFRRV